MQFYPSKNKLCDRKRIDSRTKEESTLDIKVGINFAVYLNSCLFHHSQFSESGNQSLSVLTFIPTVDDDGKYLTCRSENPFIPDSAIEDKWRLVVHCKFAHSHHNSHYFTFSVILFVSLPWLDSHSYSSCSFISISCCKNKSLKYIFDEVLLTCIKSVENVRNIKKKLFQFFSTNDKRWRFLWWSYSKKNSPKFSSHSHSNDNKNIWTEAEWMALCSMRMNEWMNECYKQEKEIFLFQWIYSQKKRGET